MMKGVTLVLLLILCCRCSVSRQLNRAAHKTILQTAALKTAHVGISIFEPGTNRYWYNYQGDHYFVPASNTKMITCYAAMKYLGDSIVGLRYGIPEERWFHDHAVVIEPTGDPTFLHNDYASQPVFDFLKDRLVAQTKKPGFMIKQNLFERWGSGWSWDDYLEAYMPERSSFPALGNTITVSLRDTGKRLVENPDFANRKIARPFTTGTNYFDSLLNKTAFRFSNAELIQPHPFIKITRNIVTNDFEIERSNVGFEKAEIPFVTNDFYTAIQFVADTLKTQFAFTGATGNAGEYYWDSENGDITTFHINKWNVIYSRPTDSVLQPMMYNSDNFFAEQSLLMVSNEVLGVMNDAKIIDTLLKTDFSTLPQKPRWVDGSGLSRYNLFTPQDFVAILNKMKTDFGVERMKRLFPTGGTGTFKNYFVQDSNFLFAKTGSMSGVNCLSGFLYTRKAKLLFFSVLINNQQAPAATVRRAVEAFLQDVRRRY